MNSRLQFDLPSMVDHYEDDVTLIEPTNIHDDGLEMLLPRLHRALINDASGGTATHSRYAIWAHTLRDYLVAASEAISDGDTDQAQRHIVRTANCLAAYVDGISAIDGARDRDEDAVDQ